MIDNRTELYDSLLSLNTVIENPSSRLTNLQSSSLCSSPDSSQYVSPDSSQHLSLESCPLDGKQSAKPVASPQPVPADSNSDPSQSCPTFSPVTSPRQPTLAVQPSQNLVAGLLDPGPVRPGVGCSPELSPAKDQPLIQLPETSSSPEGGSIREGELLPDTQEKIQTGEGGSYSPTASERDDGVMPSAAFSLSTCSLPEVRFLGINRCGYRIISRGVGAKKTSTRSL